MEIRKIEKMKFIPLDPVAHATGGYPPYPGTEADGDGGEIGRCGDGQRPSYGEVTSLPVADDPAVLLNVLLALHKVFLIRSASAQTNRTAHNRAEVEPAYCRAGRILQAAYGLEEYREEKIPRLHLAGRDLHLASAARLAFALWSAAHCRTDIGFR